MDKPKIAITPKQLDALFYDFEEVQKRSRRIKRAKIALGTIVVVTPAVAYAAGYRINTDQLMKTIL